LFLKIKSLKKNYRKKSAVTDQAPVDPKKKRNAPAPPAKKEELPEKAPGKGEKGGPPA
jgi:hypothetical protein